MESKKNSLLVLIFGFILNHTYGQSSDMLFLFDNVPSSRNVNIAAFDDSLKFNFSLPLLSSTQVSANSDFLYSNIIKHRSLDGSKYLDVDSFLASLRENNSISLMAKLNLIRFGFKIKDSYLSFSVDEKINFNIGVDRDIFQFLANGNSNYYNNQALGGLKSDFSHTREISLAFVKKINSKKNSLSFGIKPKYYFGLSDLNLNNEFYYTNENNFSNLGFNVVGQGTVSGPVDIISNGNLDLSSIESNFDFSNYITNTKNKGLGFDVGFNYSIDIGKKNDNENKNDSINQTNNQTKKIKIEFSVIDFGKINWSSNTYEIDYELAYQFDGFKINNSLDQESDNYVTFGDVISNKLDSLETTNILNSTYNKNYSKVLSPKFYLNTSYIFSNKISAGILFTYSNNGSEEDLNLLVHSSLRVSDIIHLSSSYSRKNNFGVGLSIKGGPFQIYALTDNIFSTYKFTSNPYELNNISFNLGINFIL